MELEIGHCFSRKILWAKKVFSKFPPERSLLTLDCRLQFVDHFPCRRVSEQLLLQKKDQIFSRDSRNAKGLCGILGVQTVIADESRRRAQLLQKRRISLSLFCSALYSIQQTNFWCPAISTRTCPGPTLVCERTIITGNLRLPSLCTVYALHTMPHILCKRILSQCNAKNVELPEIFGYMLRSNCIAGAFHCVLLEQLRSMRQRSIERLNLDVGGGWALSQLLRQPKAELKSLRLKRVRKMIFY